VNSVVIVGAGHAGVQAAISLRDNGFEGSVTLVHGEPGTPYQRPPLSKNYLTGETRAERIVIRTVGYFERRGIQILNAHASDVDRRTQRVHLDDGRAVPYDRLILALGAYNWRPAIPGIDLVGVLGLRSMADADSLRSKLDRSRQVLVVGGGYVGLEFAAHIDRPVTVLEARERVLSRTSTREISEFIAARSESHGAAIRTDAKVAAIGGRGKVEFVELSTGEQLSADLVLVAVGVMPNTDLAERAGLACDDGVLVDDFLRTSDPNIFAIGDCARLVRRSTGNSTRLESVQNAVDQARATASTITGRASSYEAVPWFWSEQFGIKLQIAGLTSARHFTALHGDPEQGRFSVLSFDGVRLAAVETVNLPGDHLAARRLLAQAEPPTVDDLSKYAFSLHDYAHNGIAS
jgi:3-phenylpropionate/trans-cinnamate dioxygenase ferredoxin reductase subunit